MRRSLLCLSLPLGLALASTACAVDLPDDEPVGEAVQAQFPPDLHVGEFSFEQQQIPFVRVVATNADLARGSQYQTFTEYWAGNGAMAVENVRSLQMTYTSASAPSDGQLQSFLAPTRTFDAPLATAQVISTSQWIRGTFTSTAPHERLFRAADPGDPRHAIGLLIEQDAALHLTRAVWYKTSVQTWTIFDPIPPSLAWTAVTDRAGNPSVDPADIEATTWFHYAMP